MNIKRTMVFFLLFATTISCQKSKYPAQGHFSEFKIQTRTIASTGPSKAKLSFSKFQDPKQILLYCKLNSNKPKTCYSVNLDEALTKFLKSNPSNKNNVSIKDLKETLNYQDLVIELDTLTKKALNNHGEYISDLVLKRKVFCEKNSKKDLAKCLNQYIKRDTFFVLNKYQSNYKLNGLEYLYLKNKIKDELSSHFSTAITEIEINRETSI